MLRIFITNLGKYAEGILMGEWVNLPIDAEELEEVKARIGINAEYEEMFITDYESDIDGLTVGEYDAIDDLNELVEELENVDPEIIGAFLEEGYNLEYAVEHAENAIVYYDCYDMEDVARAFCEECGILDSIPESLQDYFDFAAYGRDMKFYGTYVFTSAGNCVQLLD